MLRPLVVINSEVLLQLNPTPSVADLTSAFVFFIYMVKDHMLLKGVVETFDVLIDCSTIGLFSLPLLTIRSVFQTLRNQFKHEVRQIFCLNCGLSFSFVWNVIKLMLDQHTQHKVYI